MMDLQSTVSSTPLRDTTIETNLLCQSSSELPSSPPNNLLHQCNNLIKEAKNFNLHANVLKQLLNLKDRSSGYEIYARRQSVETINTINSASSDTCVNNNQSSSVEPPIDLESLTETIKLLNDEIIESHRLGFCLAYNIQCFHKRLTGSPIDLHSSANMIRKLQEKYDSFKTREAILKYEFQEKRKLLRRLRYQLEETREDWRLLRVTKRPRQVEKQIDGENNNQDEDALWSETLRQQFASKRKQPSEESGFAETNARGEGVEGACSSLSSSDTSEGPSDDTTNQQGTSTSGDQTKITRTTGYEDLAIALDNRRAKLDHLEDECYNLFASLSARSTGLAPANNNNQLNAPITLPIVSPLLFPDDLTDDQLLDDEEDEDEEVDENDVDVDELSDPLSDEFDELNLPVDTLDPIDATEEIDTSDLPWDSNNLYESRATSLVTTESNQQSSPNNLPNNQESLDSVPTSLTFSQSNMVHIGVGMDDDEEDDEYTQQEMESLAETGEPLVLCRLRRRAVEILISRLRDEKILHQSREAELKEQLDELKRLNEDLKARLGIVSSDWSLQSTSGRLNSVLITSMFTMLTAGMVVYFFK